jgi:hypothetical protein
MLNPFITPTLTVAELEGKRRKQFKLTVYAILIVMTLLLLAVLIQGCKAQQLSSGKSNAVTSVAGPGHS